MDQVFGKIFVYLLFKNYVMKNILFILFITSILYFSCNKSDASMQGIKQSIQDSLDLAADTMYIRNEIFDTSRTTNINSKKVYMYHCDMYFPISVIGVVNPSVVQGATFEYKKPTESYYSGNSIFYYKTLSYITGKTYVEVGVDTFGFQYHWHFYNGNNTLNTLDRTFKL